MSTDAVAAVDLGATSGRVMLGYVGHNEIRLRPVARFPNTPVRTIDGLHWNILELYRSILAGLGSAARDEPGLRSIGVDSWAVDYALIRGGRMLGTPYHYRDERTAAGVEAVHALVGAEELYSANGLQHLPFNTLFQLAADAASGDLELAERMLLIPDLVGYWLTGRAVAERTNASTTGLLNPSTREWDDELIARLGLPRGILPELVSPGDTVGPLLPAVAAETGLGAVPVTAIGSHDTASAVVAVPARGEDFAYISCGTWGLVGVELEHPVISEAGRAANFTNEGGVDGRVRYLHNVMGLWLLSESVRTWERSGETIELPALLAAAASVTTPVAVFDANDPRFLTPGDMPARIAEFCVEHGLPVPSSRAEFVRSIVESLADAFAHAVRTAAALSGKTVSVIHIVGGGALNELLCQLTADRSGLPVLAGPVEATAIGNILVQARAQGLASGSLESLRAIVSSAFSPVLYTPAR
ncbi:rhamnulokinase [Salinibacterium sp. SYSU T00001]|uniref:rhamnulokinase n=1 Tax=Homoserinimonas sedimenticola TaxID=2986805 RepID=UPI002235933C|nr:rhamnulokinase family protein [Salinibacterium sedimenticola]MCW4385628.1 rhamnulokinase [Salinibacterium sedimenticola]